MGIKNRTGCCCGSGVPCLNVVTTCQGMYYTPSVYVKNGVVVDSNGSWPLKQPTGAIPRWQTDPIKFTTPKWTAGDCTQAAGDAYYRYSVGTSPYQNSYDSIGMGLTVEYAVKQCGEAKLFTDSKTSNTTRVAFKPNKDLTCDPIGGAFTFSDDDALSPPWSAATVAFEVDEDATRMCGCRYCNAGGVSSGFTLPMGDVVLSYDIDDGENAFSGSIVLKKKTEGEFLVWTENAGWWPGSVCSEEGYSGDGENIVLGCDSLRFLKWCSDPLSTGPRTVMTSSKIGEIRYNLVDPSSEKPSQGSIVIKDESPFDGICCYPCVFPRKDLKMTCVRHVHVESVPPKDTYTTMFEVDLTYSDEMRVVDTGSLEGEQIARWKSDKMYPGDVVAADMEPAGLQNPGEWYFDCDIPWGIPNIAMFGRFFNAPPGPLDTFYSLSPQWSAAEESTCEPFHMVYAGEVDGFGVGYIFYIDEVE